MPTLQEIKTTAAEADEELIQKLLSAFSSMVRARVLEDRLASLYRAGGRIVGGVYVGRGQEAFSASLAAQLEPGRDVYGPLIRDQAGRMAFGFTAIESVRTYFGSVKGPMRGRDGNVHWGYPRKGVPAMISHLGSLIPVVTGMLFAKRMKGEEGFVGGTSLGDGATSTGAFHEALNQAAVEKLPLVLGIANNQFAYSTPTEKQFACENLADRALGYGCQGYQVNGTDLLSCIKTFSTAAERARAGEGPQLVVGNLLRLSGHGEHDDFSYLPKELQGSELARDCLDVAKELILKEGWMSKAELKELEKEAHDETEEAIGKAMAESGPDPFDTEWSALATKNLAEGHVSL